MGALAGIFGAIGGLCMVMGITTAAEIVPVLGAEFTVMFWMVLAAVLLLISIVLVMSKGPNG